MAIEITASVTEPSLLGTETSVDVSGLDAATKQATYNLNLQKKVTAQLSAKEASLEKKGRQVTMDVNKESQTKLSQMQSSLRNSLKLSTQVVSNIISTALNNPSGSVNTPGNASTLDVSNTGVEKKTALQRINSGEILISNVRFNKAQQDYEKSASAYIEADNITKAIEGSV
jgi:hypothetical protein